jgi:hypothetical protein
MKRIGIFAFRKRTRHETVHVGGIPVIESGVKDQMNQNNTYSGQDSGKKQQSGFASILNKGLDHHTFPVKKMELGRHCRFLHAALCRHDNILYYSIFGALFNRNGQDRPEKTCRNQHARSPFAIRFHDEQGKKRKDTNKGEIEYPTGLPVRNRQDPSFYALILNDFNSVTPCSPFPIFPSSGIVFEEGRA